ncbi:MAG: phasin family protein [Novosphingobium sp.]
MADIDQSNTAEDAAERAYAAAAEKAVVAKAIAEQPVVAEDEALIIGVKADEAPSAPELAADSVIAAAPAKKRASAKPVSVKEPLKAAATELAVVADAVEAKAEVKAATLLAKLKDSKVAKTAEDLGARVQGAVKDAQDRAKTAFEKSQALLADVGEFAKGNLNALAESGKILRTGVQAIGKDYVETAKSTVGTVQADIKELREVKSPSEFVKLQGSLVRKHFDTARANTSKRTQAVRNLANEAIKPISNRVTVARELVKKAA